MSPESSVIIVGVSGQRVNGCAWGPKGERQASHAWVPCAGSVAKTTCSAAPVEFRNTRQHQLHAGMLTSQVEQREPAAGSKRITSLESSE